MYVRQCNCQMRERQDVTLVFVTMLSDTVYANTLFLMTVHTLKNRWNEIRPKRMHAGLQMINYFNLISMNDLLLWITYRSPFGRECAACAENILGWMRTHFSFVKAQVKQELHSTAGKFLNQVRFYSHLGPWENHWPWSRVEAVVWMNSDLQFYRHILILISGFQYKVEVSYRSWLKVISQNISLVQILQILGGLHYFHWRNQEQKARGWNYIK